MAWWKWLLVVYLFVGAFQFLVGKLKDPMNPAGYLDPKLWETLESFQNQNK